jgi:hypothetical protein
MTPYLKLTVGLLALGSVGQVQAAPVFNPGNGHYYDYVSTSVSNAQAFTDAANAAPIAGYQSYLLTITSAAESAFIGNNVTVFNTWLGGSDAATEGVWQWLVGPETGQIFFGPGAPAGSYANWSSGNPTSDPTKNFLATFGGVSQEWFDTAPQSLGYVVEYSLIAASVPEPGTWAMMLAGAGLVGFALRREKKAARVLYG